MSVDAVMHTDFPSGFVVFFGTDGKAVMTPQGFEDVLLIAEVVSVSSARKDYDDRTAKYGRYGIPVYVVVDPYAAEVVVHSQPTGSGCIAAHTHEYGSGKLPIELADGRTHTLDLDELPRPEADAR
ncbi:Uma2 family endonuclease [Kitasatospora purpeofusca]|uniref:Uma2 family endonuclease n=1 Tax=Kitasatospora purpeofusca TaxID=67352 RepID=UPI0030F20796